MNAECASPNTLPSAFIQVTDVSERGYVNIDRGLCGF